MTNPNGPSVETVEDWRDAEIDAMIDEQQAKESANSKQFKCTVCHTNWVDAANGEDTCPSCRRL